MNRLRIMEGEITKMAVDAIVVVPADYLMNSNPGMELQYCAPGEAKLVDAHGCRAEHVIQVVPPAWHDGELGEDRLLASCYRSCFSLMAQHNMQTIALPCIGTGAYGFPMQRAARLALVEISRFLRDAQSIEKVFVVCSDEVTYQAYSENVVYCEPS